MKSKVVRKVLAALLAAAMVIGMVGCNSSEEAATTKPAVTEEPAAEEPAEETAEADLTIGVSWCAIESQMWAEYQEVIQAECKAAGITYVESVAENDTQKQNQQIEDFIAQGVDAIIIAPADGEAVVPAVQKCNEAGIPVIMANRAAGEGAEVYATISSDNPTMVKREVDYIAGITEAGKTYKCLELVGSLTDANAIARQEGFEDGIAKYPEMFELVATVPTEWKAENALTGVQNALASDPDIDLIFCPSDTLLPAVVSALQQVDKYKEVGEEGHVTIITFDGAADAVNLIRENYVDIVSVQSATEQAKLCVEAAVAAANGEEAVSFLDPGFEVTVENCDTEYADFSGY